MTLQEYRNAKYEDFFFAVVVRRMSWEEAKKVLMYLPEYPEGITAIDVLKISIEEALLEFGEEATEERKKEIEEEIKKTITSNLDEQYETMVLKCQDVYIDLGAMEEIQSDYQIKFLYPIESYYSKDDISFDEDEEGNPYLDVDLEPFNQFLKDYFEGKIC